MFGWLHRKAIEKTAVPECSDKAVDAWMRRQNGAEKLRKDEFREIGKHCYRDPGQAKDDEERNRWLLDREVALEWYCRWKRTLIQLNDERFQADLRRRRGLLELELARLEHYRNVPASVLFATIQEPERSRRFYEICRYQQNTASPAE